MRKNTYQKKLLIWTLFKQCDVDHIQCTQQTFISMKTSFLFVFRRGLQGVLKTSWSRRIYSSWSYILKTPSRRFQDLLKTSSRRLAKMSSKHLQDVLKTFWRRLERRVQLVFETYWEDGYLHKALPRWHFWEIYGQGTIFPIANSLDIPKLLKQFFLKNNLRSDCFCKQRRSC